MVSVKLYTGLEWTIHPKLKQNLDILLNDVKQSRMDLVFVLDGPEGLGKSFMSRGLGRYCATVLGSTFDPSDISWDINTYIENSLKAGRAADTGKHKINVLDEGRHALHRARGGSRGNVRFTNYLSECRDLGQIHIIIAPAFHDLDKYLIMWRMQVLFHTVKNYSEDKKSETGVSLLRGEYKVFINAAGGKKALSYVFENRGYQYPHRYEVHARWPAKEVFTTEELKAYEKGKFEATIKKYHLEDEKQKELEEMEKVQQQYYKVALFAKKWGMTPAATIKAIKSERLKGRKCLKQWFVHMDHYDNPPDLDSLENVEARKRRADHARKIKQEKAEALTKEYEKKKAQIEQKGTDADVPNKSEPVGS